ncbi:hypothetical protein Tco_0722393 [Tanacetum coccineum]
MGAHKLHSQKLEAFYLNSIAKGFRDQCKRIGIMSRKSLKSERLAPFGGVTPTDLKPQKKRISPYSKPKTSNPVRDVPQKKQVTETQPAEETVATADATQSLGASESAED